METELWINECSEVECIRVTATKLEVYRNMHKYLVNCHFNLKGLDNFIRIWCNEDVSDDIIEIRKDLADLERKCEKLIDNVD